MNLSKRQRTALLMLLPPEEINTKKDQLPKNHTSLWKHWQSFVSRQLDLGKSPIWLKSVQDGIKVILRHTSIVSIEQANNPCLVSDLLLELQKERSISATTRNTYLKSLKSYMIWLEKRGIIAQNNLRKAEKSTEPIRGATLPTKREIEEVLYHLTTRKYLLHLGRLRNLLFVWLLSYTGARNCELLNMEIGDCYKSRDGWKIRISGRKQKARVRYYSCPQHIQEVYEQYVTLRNQKGFIALLYSFLPRVESLGEEKG